MSKVRLAGLALASAVLAPVLLLTPVRDSLGLGTTHVEPKNVLLWCAETALEETPLEFNCASGFAQGNAAAACERNRSVGDSVSKRNYDRGGADGQCARDTDFPGSQVIRLVPREKKKAP